MEDQNRFISLAKDSEIRTPSTGTKNNKFVSGLKFSSINVNGIRPKKNRCVSANMPKKIRVGWSENLFIFLQIFI